VTIVSIAIGRLLTSAWSHHFWVALAFFLLALLLGWLVCRLFAEHLETSRNLHFQRQLAERSRITRDLNDTLLQTIEASKMIADDALDLPPDPVQMQRTMRRLSEWLGQAIKEGQQALDSLRMITSENRAATDSLLSRWIRKLSRGRHPGEKDRS
jgi:signal transduction histidine kinase